MTPSGSEPTTCRFVVQCLNHYATARPLVGLSACGNLASGQSISHHITEKRAFLLNLYLHTSLFRQMINF